MLSSLKFSQIQNKSFSIQHDVGLSVIIAPFKYIVPILSYVILYPLILNKNGYAVIGLWSLLRTITSYVSLTDVGFSSLLTREAGKDRTSEYISKLYKDYVVSQRFYIAICLFLLSILFISGDTITSLLKETYSGISVTGSIGLLFISATLSLLARLDAAVLSARNENYYVQIIIVLLPIFTFSFAIYGAAIGYPIEGLSVGTLTASVVQFLSYRRRLKSYHKEWINSKTPLKFSETCVVIKALIHKGWHFYSISLAMILRDPSFNWIIAYLLGLEALGIYSIAQRIVVTARDLIASGFTSLLPALAYLHRTDKKDEISFLLHVALLFLLSSGAGIMGTIIATADFILPLWLGKIQEGVISTIRILGVWYVITLASIPFWYLLQALRYESKASLSIWIHTFSILILIPINSVIKLNLYYILIYWVLIGFFCQILIYFYVKKTIPFFWDLIFNKRIIINFIVTFSFLITALTISCLTAIDFPLTFYHKIVIRFIPILLYITSIFFIIKSPLRKYINKKNSL